MACHKDGNWPKAGGASGSEQQPHAINGTTTTTSKAPTNESSPQALSSGDSFNHDLSAERALKRAKLRVEVVKPEDVPSAAGTLDSGVTTQDGRTPGIVFMMSPPDTVTTCGTTTSLGSSSQSKPWGHAFMTKSPMNRKLLPSPRKTPTAASRGMKRPHDEHFKISAPVHDHTPLLAIEPSRCALPARIIPFEKAKSASSPSKRQDASSSPSSSLLIKSDANEGLPVYYPTPLLQKDRIASEEEMIVSHLENSIINAGTGSQSACGLAQVLRFSVIAHHVLTGKKSITSLGRVEKLMMDGKEENKADEPSSQAKEEPILPPPSLYILMQEWCQHNQSMLNDFGEFEDVSVMNPLGTYLHRSPVSTFKELSLKENDFLTEYDKMRLLRTFLAFITSRVELISDMCEAHTPEKQLMSGTFSFWVQLMREYV